MKNAQTISQIVVLEKPPNATPTAIVLVTANTAMEMKQTVPMGNGLRISATIAATKTESTRHPSSASLTGTSSATSRRLCGTGMRKIMTPTSMPTPPVKSNESVNFLPSCFYMTKLFQI